MLCKIRIVEPQSDQLPEKFEEQELAGAAAGDGDKEKQLQVLLESVGTKEAPEAKRAAGGGATSSEKLEVSQDAWGERRLKEEMGMVSHPHLERCKSEVPVPGHGGTSG